ncbi:IclR family transcriptional regulator domain-containing protein [Nesterenkonia marinintestina]|uniref:IclR family transcriptional regulator domain-containing protein n=1 Tax=Nesterenkonia marinintestina TaxID=2979865 RepID=UPI0021C023C2|nr:IclR family transcriptional regulator C-terminal domain-containing protein [Nesterenkonia sp. GX14115]
MTEENTEADAPRKEDFVRSLANGLKILEAFAAGEPRMTLSEVARRTGLSRASSRRMLHTLVHQGYATTDGRDFSLTPQVLNLGMGFSAGGGLRDVLQPALQTLARTVDESSSASVLAGTEIIYIARVHTRRIMRMDLDVGTRLPAFATSMGRILLGDLGYEELRSTLAGWHRPQLTPTTVTDVDELIALVTEARRAGFAMVDQELEAGLRSVAVPVRHPDHGVVAAMNVSVSAGLESAEESLSRVLDPLRECAERAELSVRAWERGTGALTRHTARASGSIRNA